MSARILIVEDERITAEDLRDILTDLGYTVTASVSSGADAIARAEETRPDLALMDIRIKGEMDGTATARILRERFNIPVVYLTAHADSATLARAKDAEPLGYITKPFQEAELHASIEIALHKHREDLKVREKEDVAGLDPARYVGRRYFSRSNRNHHAVQSGGGSLDGLEFGGGDRAARRRDLPDCRQCRRGESGYSFVARAGRRDAGRTAGEECCW